MKKSLVFVFVFVLLMSVTSRAQKGEVFLTDDTLNLQEVSVKSLRYVVSEKQSAIPLSVIPAYEIEKESGISISEFIAREPGIALYRDGAWATSISLRGLGENRIISMVDGNRIETATDLAGGLSMVDPSELERIEIIKGAASSIHGTGAMGGVVNLITKKGAYRQSNGFSGEASTYYHTVNRMLGTHLAMESGDEKWFVRASGGYRNAQNIQTPEGELENSQFTDYNYNLSAGLKPFKNHEILLSFQDFMAADVGIPGGAPLAASATATYLEASRRLISGEYLITPVDSRLSQLKFKYFNQFINREVELLPNMPSATSGNKRLTVNAILPSGAHYTQGGTAESHWKLSDRHSLVAGVDYWQRIIHTAREKHITQEILDDFQMVLKTLELVRGEKPVPDARFSSGGIFLQDQVSLLGDQLELQTGARLDGIQVRNEEARDPVFLLINEQAQDPVPGQRLVFPEQTQFGLSWSVNAGLLAHLGYGHDLMVNMGRSFRSASLEERFKYIDLGSKVRLGDPELKPEKGWCGDLGYRYWGDKFHARFNLYAHYVTDMIVEQPGQFVYNETDTLPALINTNVNEALLFGYDLSADYLIMDHLKLLLTSSFTRGLDLSNSGNLPLIAPWNTSVGLRYRVPALFSLTWTTWMVAAQNKIAEGETTTPAYCTSDFSLVSEKKTFGRADFRIILGVNNVFNKSYVNHLATNRGSIMAEPGRNVAVKLEMCF